METINQTVLDKLEEKRDEVFKEIMPEFMEKFVSIHGSIVGKTLKSKQMPGSYFMVADAKPCLGELIVLYGTSVNGFDVHENQQFTVSPQTFDVLNTFDVIENDTLINELDNIAATVKESYFTIKREEAEAAEAAALAAAEMEEAKTRPVLKIKK